MKDTDIIKLPSLAWLVVSAIGGGLAGLVVAGVLAGRAGVGISPALLAWGAMLGALPRLLAGARGRWHTALPEFVLVVLAAGAITGVALWLAWPALLPLGRSVDAVHHLQLIDWLASEQRLPPLDARTRGLMGEMTAYPPGFHLVVVEAAALLRTAPIRVLFPVVALLGGLAAALVALLATSAAGERGWRLVLPGLITPLLLLAYRAHTIEAFIDHSYYAMVLGLVFVLLACAWAVCEPRISDLGALQVGLILAALLATYPLWLPIPVLVLLASLALDGERWPRRTRLLSLVLAGSLPLVLALADLPSRLGTGQTVLEHQGVVTQPSAASLTPVFLALPALLLLVWSSPFVANRPRQRFNLFPVHQVVVTFLLALGFGGALAVAAWWGIIAPYHGVKLLFVIVPLAAAVVGAAIMRMAQIRRLPLRAAALVLAALVVLASGWRVLSLHAEQLLTSDIVAAADWLRANDPDGAASAELVGAPAGQLGYWLQVGLLGQWRDEADAAVRSFNSPALTPESWAVDTRESAVAVAAVLGEVPPGAEVAARFGQVAVLRRTPLDVQAVNPLVLRYNTFWDKGRIKTALELIRPLAGPLPLIELQLRSGDRLITSFALPPNPERTKPQYLGADLIPQTFGGVGYINADVYPTFAPPAQLPDGDFVLSLRLSVDGVTVDERQLATGARLTNGEIANLATQSGELNYLRRSYDDATLHATHAQFPGQLVLTGWREELSQQAGELSVLLRWQAPAPPVQLASELRLIDQNGAIVAHSRGLPQNGFYPSWRWRPGEEVVERRVLLLPAALQEGSYTLQASAYDMTDPSSPVEVHAVELGQVVIAHSVGRR